VKIILKNLAENAGAEMQAARFFQIAKPVRGRDDGRCRR